MAGRFSWENRLGNLLGGADFPLDLQESRRSGVTTSFRRPEGRTVMNWGGQPKQKAASGLLEPAH